MFSARQYAINLGLYARGFRWLWTRVWKGKRPPSHPEDWIAYKPGWGPWKFLIPYCSTYLASVILGLGCVSLSRFWYDRSECCDVCGDFGWDNNHRGMAPKEIHGVEARYRYPFSRFMTRALDWAFPGSAHGRHTGPILWGSRSAWE